MNFKHFFKLAAVTAAVIYISAHVPAVGGILGPKQ
jgi:hypothetical protein